MREPVLAVHAHQASPPPLFAAAMASVVGGFCFRPRWDDFCFSLVLFFSEIAYSSTLFYE